MSSKALSPTAHLLRTSRLFSLPFPSPRPSLDYNASIGADASSRTATLPYPTHQAIETTRSSQARGDWGLKRSLPLRTTTRTRNPTLRVNSVDTVESITDFESASDHVMTLQKWQAMDIPMTTYADSESKTGRPRSVYEERYDNTDSTKADVFHRRRWRFNGPWIAGMNPKEFEAYITGQVGGRKEQFRDFLRGKVRDMEISLKRSQARQKGFPVSSSDELDANDHVEISDQNLDTSIHLLRDEYSMGSILVKYVREFLDLPDMPTSAVKQEAVFANMGSRFNDHDVFNTTRQGPPKTHPGAGLSYIRTGSFLGNHPILGPRAHRQPIPARVVRPRLKTGTTGFAIIGVGGILTTEPKYERPIKVGMPLDGKLHAEEVGLVKPDFSKPGGTKIWVEPQYANVNMEGKIDLVVKHANRTNVGYHTGEEMTSFLARPRGTGLSSRAQPLMPAGLGKGFDGALDSAELQTGPARQKSLNAQETSKVLQDFISTL